MKDYSKCNVSICQEYRFLRRISEKVKITCQFQCNIHLIKNNLKSNSKEYFFNFNSQKILKKSKTIFENFNCNSLVQKYLKILFLNLFDILMYFCF